MKRVVLICASVVGLLAAVAPASDLSGLIDPGATFWTLTPETFMGKTEPGAFKWNTPGPNGEAHYPGYGNSPALSFLEFRVYDANISFSQGLAKEAKLSLFNRGDAGSMQQTEFVGLARQIDGAVEKWLGVKGVSVPRQSLARGNVILAKRWIKPPWRITLQWSALRENGVFRAEFIQLELEPAESDSGGKNAPAVAVRTGSAGKTGDLKKNLEKEADGTVWISTMPMVDQGQKGYCAVAATERVMRYYGSEVSEHLLAGIVNSSATAGTDSAGMLRVLKQVGPTLGLNVRVLSDLNVQGFQRMIGRYNHAAKRARKKEIVLGDNIVVSDIYAKMDPAILMSVRCKDMQLGYQAFQRDVAQKIDAGIPLLWGVELGLYPESGLPQKGGGHMRLIIGYNRKKAEIVYSDSWGASHARKVMPMDQAWTMTTLLATLEMRVGL